METKRKKNYHRENCDCKVRTTIKDELNRTVILEGRHAFEWSITIQSETRVVVYSYPNGKLAREAFKQIKRRK